MKLLHYRPKVPNFGDDLNAILWPALVPSLLGALSQEAGDDPAFVGIGTIVGIDPGDAQCLHVFSSGVGYTSMDAWTGRSVEYHCVRGPFSARVLGLPDSASLTDGAILTPLMSEFHLSASTARAGTIVIPHFETVAFPGWPAAAKMAGFDLVDPRKPPAVVISRIAQAKLVLTESLHGAILADAFGVPWRPFAVSRNFSKAKWADWAGSLNLRVAVAVIPPPDAVTLLRYGKPSEPFGTFFPLDLETACREFRSRIAPPRSQGWMKTAGKGVLGRLPAARKLLGFSATRTAEALTKLAEGAPLLSDPAKREDLRSAMLARLDALAKRHGASLAIA